MDSKIIALIAGSFLLTGCMSAKVEQLHDTTTKLTTDVDSYVTLTNKVVDLNKQSSLYIEGKKDLLLMIRSPILGNTQEEKEEYNSKSFNRVFINQYTRFSTGESIKLQSTQISEYFKNLPKSLESKNLDQNLQGLVKNIDILNQSLEGNIQNNGDAPKGKLTPIDDDLINKILMEAYKGHQYKDFDKNINKQYKDVLKAIIHINEYTNSTLIPFAQSLNKDFASSHQELLTSYAKKHKEANSSPAKWSNVAYSNGDLKKIYQLLEQPIVPNSASNDLSQEKPQQERTQLYTKFCNYYATSPSEDYVIKWYPDDDIKTQPTDYSFNFEKIIYIKGSEPSCELMDILGLLIERKYDQIDLTNFEKKTSDFNNIVDFLMKKIPSEKMEK